MESNLANILIWGGLIFLMMRFGCGSHLFRRSHGQEGHGHHGHTGGGCCGGHGTHAGKAQDEEASQPQPKALPMPDAGQKAIDPVCGMAVTPEKAKTSFYRGRVHFLCSRECREQFEVDPGLYVEEDGRPREKIADGRT